MGHELVHHPAADGQCVEEALMALYELFDRDRHALGQSGLDDGGLEPLRVVDPKGP